MPQTIDQMLITLANAGKSVKERQLRRYLSHLNISPAGAYQRPRIYPADTMDRLLIHLGLAPVQTPTRLLTVREAKRLAKKGGRS